MKGLSLSKQQGIIQSKFTVPNMPTDSSKSKLENRVTTSTFRGTGPIFVTGWRQLPLKVRFGFAIIKYALQRKKYPRFSLRSIKPMGKGKILAIEKMAMLDGYFYTAVIRIPRWPSAAFDHMIANGGLGIDERALAAKTQIDSVILSVTRKCTYECEHCYEYANRADEESVSTAKWNEVIAQLQRIGTSVIVLSGGEPMLRYADVITILHSADKRLSDFHLHTTGLGMSLDRAYALKKAGLVSVGVGLDYPDAERQDQFRGRQGAFHDAVKAIDACNQAGIFTYTNTCLQKDCVRRGDLYNFLEFAKKLRVGTVQLLEPKPCGRYGSKKQEDLLTEDDKNIVIDFVKKVNHDKAYKYYPPVSYIAYIERPENFGCMMGGLSHFTIDGAGNVNPCVFVPVSFGNILKEDFLVIYHRMRTVISQPYHTQCPSVLLRDALELHKNHSKRATVPYEEIRKEWMELLTKKRE